MRIIPLILILASLVSCNKPAPNTLRVGTIAGPETELVQVAQAEALQRYGLTIKIVEFNDYNLPNEALNEGSLDANVYQHLPYLLASNSSHGYHLEPLAKTFLYPMGIYSSKYKSLDKLPDNAQIALPNDPSNETRALQLLVQANLITLKKERNGSIKDIANNPHHFQFHELDAAQLPRILPDVDLAIINTTFAELSGLSPSRDALYLESKTSPYANLIVVRTDSNPEQKKLLMQFVQAFQSEAVKQAAKKIFGQEAIPAW